MIHHGAVSSKKDRKFSDVSLQTQRYHLNQAAALFNCFMSNMLQIMICKRDDDDNETAETDTALRMAWEYVKERLQPKPGRINLTKAAVPDRPRNRIEREYFLVACCSLKHCST